MPVPLAQELNRFDKQLLSDLIVCLVLFLFMFAVHVAIFAVVINHA